MTIKQNGGIFGRNPEYKDVTAESVTAGQVNSNGAIIAVGAGVFGDDLSVTGDIVSNSSSGAKYIFVGPRSTPDTSLPTGTGTDETGVNLWGIGIIDAAAYSNSPMRLNRMGTDGNLVSFLAQGVLEGAINVSGTTVSYTGGHLARWSRLPDDTKDTTLVKGTVMTNLDEMVVWHYEAQPEKEAYTEENEQLNKMTVSSVEGDPNVAGVFVSWDDNDDGFNDMQIAMTGDMVIRIAQGTTVARGDLLMSAGDGTAKPQGDDIVRSKTIAKVTSTHVSHTYDDGSYLVPCVLMAC